MEQRGPPIRHRSGGWRRSIAHLPHARTAGGWPMTRAASVVPFPAAAANNSRQAHAQFRDDWLGQLASYRTLSGADRAIGIALALHMNARTCQAWPSIDRIAKLTGRNAGTVWRSIGRLERAGLIAVARGRGRHVPN